MGMKLLTLGLAFILLAHSPLAVAQEKPTQQQEWSAITTVPVGSELVVEMKDGKTIKGKLRAVSTGTLTLSRNNAATDLNLINARKVYRMVGRSRLKSALIGAGVGAGTGAAIGVGATVGNEVNRREGYTALFGVVFGILGAGIGAVAGAVAGNKKRLLIYEAK